MGNKQEIKIAINAAFILLNAETNVLVPEKAEAVNACAMCCVGLPHLCPFIKIVFLDQVNGPSRPASCF